jgi:hypothetical protein
VTHRAARAVVVLIVLPVLLARGGAFTCTRGALLDQLTGGT